MLRSQLRLSDSFYYRSTLRERIRLLISPADSLFPRLSRIDIHYAFIFEKFVYLNTIIFVYMLAPLAEHRNWTYLCGGIYIIYIHISLRLNIFF